MKILNLILHAALIILININNDFYVYGRELLQPHLNENNIIPQHYDIFLNLKIAEGETNATANTKISLNIKNTTKTIHIYGTNKQILRCDIIDFSNGHTQLTEAIFENNSSEIQTLQFLQELKPGIYYLQLTYLFHFNDVKEKLNIRFTEFTQEDEKYTQLLALNTDFTSTCDIFPCFQISSFEATYYIAVAYPTRCNIISNMPVNTTVQLPEETALLTIFQTTPAIPINLVGIMIMDFVLISETHDIITIWYKPLFFIKIIFARNVTTHIIQSLKCLTQIKTVSKIDMVVLPGEFQVIQKWGLIVHSEQNIVFNEAWDSFDQKVNVAATLARSVISQLAGNYVYLSSSSNAWLREGIVSFFQLYVFPKVFEEFPSDIFIIQYAMCADEDTNYFINKILHGIRVTSHSSNLTFSSDTRYNRVPFILRMLEHIMTQEIFQNVINDYLDRYQFRSIEPDDLWTTFQQAISASDKLYLNISRGAYQVRELVDGCLMQKYDLVLSVLTDYTTGNGHMYLKNIDKDNGTNSNWTVPITYTLQNAPNFKDTMPRFFLKPFTVYKYHVDIDSKNWIIVNLQRVGCYRVRYDSTNWKRIAHYLNSDNYSKIHVVNRAQIIDDAFHFMLARSISFPMFLNIISYLKRETDYTVWYTMEPVIKYIWNICKNSQYSKVKDIMSKIWDGVLTDVDYYDKSTDTHFVRFKRNFALKWACKFGHAGCRTTATTKMMAFLTYIYQKIDNLDTWTDWKCRMGMITANKEVLEYMAQKCIYIGRQCLEYLAYCEDEDTITYYLDKLLNNPKKLMLNNETFRITHDMIIERHVEKYKVLEYILNHFQTVQLMSHSNPINIMNKIINNLYAGRNLYKIKEFLHDHTHVFGTYVVDEAESMIDARLTQIEKDMDYFIFEDEEIKEIQENIS